MNNPGKASLPVIKRLPKYYRYLRTLKNDGITSISSRELAAQMGTTASQVRQDFNCIGDVNGRQGIGYSVENLLSILEHLLFGNGDLLPTILIGCGRLGKAVSRFITTDTNGYKLIAAFDNSADEVGKEISGIRIRHIDELEAFCEENKPKVAVLCVPRDGAQQVSGRLVDLGIEGFWNDMNEPSLFYSPERLRAFLNDMATLREKDNIEQEEFFLRVIGGAMGLMNSPADYASFYHEVDGQKVRHDQVHNLYGGSMTRAAGEAFVDLRPGQRTLLYSRSSFIGSHRYGGIWLGDNNSSWAQLLANIQMMPSVQMCGFLYSGDDLCGFSSDTTPDLALRWLEFGLLTPLMRNHSAVGTRMQEYYRFPEVLPAVRNMIRLRYALLPYLYSEFMKAALENTSYFRPLAFDYPDDPDAREVEDQLLLGEGLMAAPVYVQNAHGRHVYLPESMKLLRLRAVDDYDEEILPAGHHYIRCALDEVLLFLRPGHIVPVAQPANSTSELDDASLTLWSFLSDGESAEYRMYRDDGVTTEYEKKEHWKTLQIHHS